MRFPQTFIDDLRRQAGIVRVCTVDHAILVCALTSPITDDEDIEELKH